MLKQLIILILLFPFRGYSQTEIHPIQMSPDIILNKCFTLNKEGKLDSVRTQITFFKDYFHIIESTKKFYIYVDTVKYSDSSFAVGKIILDPFMEFERRKYGEWTFYYPSGKIYSKGSYSIGAFTECQVYGPSLIGYSFKTGTWKYWYENGNLMAEGIYQPIPFEKMTNCGSDTINISNVTPTWKLFDNSGMKVTDSKEIISKINSSR